MGRPEVVELRRRLLDRVKREIEARSTEFTEGMSLLVRQWIENEFESVINPNTILVEFENQDNEDHFNERQASTSDGLVSLPPDLTENNIKNLDPALLNAYPRSRASMESITKHPARSSMDSTTVAGDAEPGGAISTEVVQYDQHITTNTSKLGEPAVPGLVIDDYDESLRHFDWEKIMQMSDPVLDDSHSIDNGMTGPASDDLFQTGAAIYEEHENTQMFGTGPNHSEDEDTEMQQNSLSPGVIFSIVSDRTSKSDRLMVNKALDARVIWEPSNSTGDPNYFAYRLTLWALLPKQSPQWKKQREQEERKE
ncbi:hypothetical protein BT63DRAFT_458100 [Microthyrium microscopicum]|uniref:Uncharacterized protein n=1 Tax=Microthyrium microscopicum TaxID=703497 RepID=A0A6A6U4B9_9PEZI|nr:hypothetical protein BT63DRAFT_458100 [Microthyrium microscopicum]